LLGGTSSILGTSAGRPRDPHVPGITLVSGLGLSRSNSLFHHADSLMRRPDDSNSASSDSHAYEVGCYHGGMSIPGQRCFETVTRWSLSANSEYFHYIAPLPLYPLRTRFDDSNNACSHNHVHRVGCYHGAMTVHFVEFTTRFPGFPRLH